jgi:hypothetical protein
LAVGQFGVIAGPSRRPTDSMSAFSTGARVRPVHEGHSYRIAAGVPGASGRGSTSTKPRATRTR